MGDTDGEMSANPSRDLEQLRANVCPVCATLAGGPDSRQPRHALLMHIKRHAKNDDRHKLWSDLNYKNYFKHGNTAKTHKLTKEDVGIIVGKYFNRPVQIVFS
jgi:hypothetical protein